MIVMTIDVQGRPHDGTIHVIDQHHDVLTTLLLARHPRRLICRISPPGPDLMDIPSGMVISYRSTKCGVLSGLIT